MRVPSVEPRRHPKGILDRFQQLPLKLHAPIHESVGEQFRAASPIDADQAANRFSSRFGKSDTADKVLKSRVGPQRVQSGIHPDPWHSSRALEKPLLQRFEGLLILIHLGVNSGHVEPTDITFLGLLQHLAYE